MCWVFKEICKIVDLLLNFLLIFCFGKVDRTVNIFFSFVLQIIFGQSFTECERLNLDQNSGIIV